MRPFAELAQSRAPTLDRLALAIAAEFREVDERAGLARLAELADELVAGGTPVEEGDALAALLGGRYGFADNEASYDHPDNSMLDLVLERGARLPILLSVVYEEVARRRGSRSTASVCRDTSWSPISERTPRSSTTCSQAASASTSTGRQASFVCGGRRRRRCGS